MICHLSFNNAKSDSFRSLKKRFAGAEFVEDSQATKKLINTIFDEKNFDNSLKIKILLKGTDFQIKVWESLIKIPMGTLSTYGEVAKSINNPKAVRAVGSALKANQIGFLIPCHRVTCKNGDNKFSWGAPLKIRMQEYENQIVNGKK